VGASGARFDGIDLMPWIGGGKAPVDRTVFWRYKRAEVRRKAVRSGASKLIVENGTEELFDLSNDAFEKKNLLPDREERAKPLRRLLAAWEKDVIAPRLRPMRTEGVDAAPI
jgi:hypothetical protein